jgi:hypothetical protein
MKIFLKKKNMNETRFSQKSWILSAIFPTMGQIYNKKYLRASLFGAGFLSFIGGAWYCPKLLLQIHKRKYL